MHICVSKITIIGSDNGLSFGRRQAIICTQCWNNVSSTLGNKLQWNLNRNLYIFIQENAFENVVWKMAAILSRSQCVKVLSLPHSMLCTAQLGGPVLKASGRVQFSLFQLADKSIMITDQHPAGGTVSQLSQLAKLSPWLTLSTKDITTSFWHYNKWFWFLSNQIMGLYHFSNRIKLNLCIYGEK